MCSLKGDIPETSLDLCRHGSCQRPHCVPGGVALCDLGLPELCARSRRTAACVSPFTLGHVSAYVWGKQTVIFYFGASPTAPSSARSWPRCLQLLIQRLRSISRQAWSPGQWQTVTEVLLGGGGSSAQGVPTWAASLGPTSQPHHYKGRSGGGSGVWRPRCL